MNLPPRPVFPRRGTLIECGLEHVTYLNSDVPAIRAKLVNAVWSVLPSADKAGLIIFLTALPPTMSGVRILRIRGKSALGEPV